MRKLNVLVVEDEECWKNIFKQAFTNLDAENIRIFYASSLIECLALMDKRIFEIFVIDLKIPLNKTEQTYSEYFSIKVKNLIDEVEETVQDFDREKFLYSYALVREIINSVPYYEILVFSSFLANTNEDELKKISEGHILEKNIKQKEKELLAKAIKTTKNKFEHTLSSFIDSVPEILPDIPMTDYSLIKNILKDFKCKNFTISQLHKGRSGTRIFHVKEQHEDNVKEVPEYLVKLGNNKIIEKEWNNCNKILGIGKIYPKQSFAPQNNLIKVLNCSCIAYPYEKGFCTFKEFFQQVKSVHVEGQTNLLKQSIQGILEKLRILQRTKLKPRNVNKLKVKDILRINTRIIKNAINNPCEALLNKRDLHNLKFVFDLYETIKDEIHDTVLSPVHGDFHGDNILLKEKSSYNSRLNDINIIDFQSFKEDKHYLTDYTRLESDIKFHLLSVFIDAGSLMKLDKYLMGQLPNNILINNPRANSNLSRDDLVKAITLIKTIREFVNNEFNSLPKMNLQYLLLLFLTSIKYICISLKLNETNEVVINYKYTIQSASYLASKLNDLKG